MNDNGQSTYEFRRRSTSSLVGATVIAFIAFGWAGGSLAAQPPSTGPAAQTFNHPFDHPMPSSAAEVVAEYSLQLESDGMDFSPASTLDERTDRTDACVESEMASKSTPGASIAIMVDGEIVHARGFGTKHKEMDEAVDTETVFRIGSTTKMMTAAAVLQQVEAGTISIDSPITDLVPEWALGGVWDYPAERAEDITAWHTLTHSSGYPDRIIYDLSWVGSTEISGLSEWAAAQREVVLHAPPGSFWNYSNGPFALAGLLVERASGVPYNEYMVNSVWRPAGMDATFLVPDDVIAHGNYSYGHYYNGPLSADEPVIAAPDTYDNWVIAPAGYAFSTPSDLVRWTDLLMTGGGDVLETTSADAMQAKQVDVGVIPEQSYGYGVFVEDVPALGGIRALNHGGNIPGFSSQLFWVPSQRVGISILANTMTSLTASAGCALRNMLDYMPGESPDYSTLPGAWDRYVGTYRGLDSIGNESGAWVERSGAADLRITFPEIVIPPGIAYSSALDQKALNTFSFDANGDGTPDDSITFIDDSESDSATSSHPRWLRNRGFVMTYQSDQIPTPTPTAAITATATFTGTATITPTATITGTPTITPTPGPSPTFTPTDPPSATPTLPGGPSATPTPTFMPSPTPIPDYPEIEVCPRLETRAPLSAIDAALANPSAVRGYGLRCYQSQPASPFNPWRRWLGLVDSGKPYEARYNPIVIKCGCP